MSELGVALQEWAGICELLGSGALLLTVRKGGIHERGGGLFALEHQRFWLLPTFVHQDGSRLRPGIPLPHDPEPGWHRLQLWAEAAGLWWVTERALLDRLELPWTEAELSARFHYRQQPWLFVIALRVHRLPQPARIPDHPSYGGCRSWIRLQQPQSCAGSAPVLPDAAFAARLAEYRRILGDPA
ncbi:MAG: DUF1802 family protein [Planctomycetes bacterium]|nr:DUF1802 family protein [Planctomycetota bacterium]